MSRSSQPSTSSNGSSLQNGASTSSRKYRLALICLLVLCVSFVYATLRSVAEGLYRIFADAVYMVFLIYCGGNVGQYLVQKENKNGPPPQHPIDPSK